MKAFRQAVKDTLSGLVTLGVIVGIFGGIGGLIFLSFRFLGVWTLVIFLVLMLLKIAQEIGEDLLLHKSGTVSVPRFIMYEGEMARNGWIGLDGKQVLVLMWP